MSEDDRPLAEPDPGHDRAGSGPPIDVQPDQSPGWRKVRLILLGSLIVSGSGMLFLGMLTAASGWYTSRSEFCYSCHIMEPYYQSWERSTHSDVTCVKCHWPPGVGEKVRGKMLGLVQLATYVTRSEGPRPVAEVADASCLRSGCHEKRTLSGPLMFHGIPFDHAPHLESLQLEESHHETKLRCTSCHGQVDQSEHMTVDKTTCYLCHFKSGLFNEGLGACTRCHQIPENNFDLGGGITFSHELAYEKGVDCKNCHGDLNRGDGQVSPEKCQFCHNRQSDLEQIGDDQLMHRLHVTEHKINCLDCHQEIEHSLEPDKLLSAAANCNSCHPDHHQEQVKMLLGVGGQSVPDHAAVMPATGVECRACHRLRQVSPTGTVLWKASADVCITCHSNVDAAELQGYNDEVRAALLELESSLQRVRTAMDLADLGLDRLASMKEKTAKLQHDVDFLKVGNGAHNIHYANTLTSAVLKELTALCRDMNIPEPQATLPENVENFR